MKYGTPFQSYETHLPLFDVRLHSLIGVLMSSEGGYVHCWSLFGERKDMGMFYGPSKEGESILAMSSDANNQYLICGDTAGEIRVWNISNYCCATVSPVPYSTSAPHLEHSWQAHLSAIIFCQWTDYQGHGNFILTGSTDHTARLWTLTGEEIGVFGQRQPWDIELLLTSMKTASDDERRETNVNNDDSEEAGSSLLNEK